jgi:DNA-directed RNA polymerase
MAMTAIEMTREGKTMMAVHDSYWTHACDLPDLARILRSQFVSLYENYDPLWEIKSQWEELFFFDLKRHAATLPDPPARGNLDLKQVLDSPYFFS